MEIHLSGLSAGSSSECCAYEHKQCIGTAASAPTASYMAHLTASMNSTSSTADIADREAAAQAAPDLIHQLYEWIGGTSCGLQGTHITPQHKWQSVTCTCSLHSPSNPMSNALSGTSMLQALHIQSSEESAADLNGQVADYEPLLQARTGTTSHKVRWNKSVCSVTCGRAW